MIGAALLANRLRLRKEALAEALSIGALSMTAMTAVNILRGTGFSPMTLALSALSFAASAWTKIHPALIIIGCGLLGAGWEALALLISPG
jgi:hypothetical protein